METKIRCSKCGQKADVMAVYKAKVLCFHCFIQQNKTLSQYLVHYLTERHRIKSTPPPPGPGSEPFGGELGRPLRVMYVPEPGSGKKPRLIARLKVIKVKAEVWVGSIEKIPPKKQKAT